MVKPVGAVLSGTLDVVIVQMVVACQQETDMLSRIEQIPAASALTAAPLFGHHVPARDRRVMEDNCDFRNRLRSSARSWADTH
jgi:hypothetical protein